MKNNIFVDLLNIFGDATIYARFVQQIGIFPLNNIKYEIRTC